MPRTARDHPWSGWNSVALRCMRCAGLTECRSTNTSSSVHALPPARHRVIAARIIFCLAKRTVLSIGSVDISPMCLVFSRKSRSLPLLSRLVFQEGRFRLLALLFELPVLWFVILNSMPWWWLNVVSSRTRQSLIFDASRGVAIVRSIIDPLPPSPSEGELVAPVKTISSFLETISFTKIPFLSNRVSPHLMRTCPTASWRLSSRARAYFVICSIFLNSSVSHASCPSLKRLLSRLSVSYLDEFFLAFGH